MENLKTIYQNKPNEKPIIISFLTLRKVIGILGISLPFIVVIGALLYGLGGMLGSISEYYYSNMREFFVGILCALSLFLFSYHGYSSETKNGKKFINIDSLASKICGIAALGVALFPTKLETEKLKPFISLINNPGLSDIIHHLSAAILFLTFSFMSLFLFRRTVNKPLQKQKKKRNRVYMSCGLLIIFCIVLIFLYNLFLKDTSVKNLNPIFWCEVVMLISFGISWLTKGETLLKDKK